MKIGFIGAGKVGFSLGKFFAEGGIPVTGYYSRHRESAQEAAAFTGTRGYESLEDLVGESDALFVTVPDGAIASVYEQLKQYEITGKQICHCSGAMTAAEAFFDVAEHGALGYSIHPLFPISSKYETYRELAGAFFCLEGGNTSAEQEGLHRWQSLLESLGCAVRSIDGSAKVRYHAACAIASNLVCGLMQESVELLRTCGFSEQEGLMALAPLIRSNVEHMLEVGPIKALTGPMERCDTTTVAKHLDCFLQESDRSMYAAVSKKLLTMAEEKHPDRDYSNMHAIFQRDIAE